MGTTLSIATARRAIGIQGQPQWLIKTVTFTKGDEIPSSLRHVLADHTDHSDNNSAKSTDNLQVFIIRRLRDLEDAGSLEEYHPHSGIKYKLPFLSRPDYHDVLLSTGIDYTEIRTWLTICDKDHAECHTQSEITMKLSGLLLIDCLTATIVPAKPEYSYVALSYVWGSAKNCDDFERNLRNRHISQTVKDSMLVVREIGMRYLWVDRYCIDQSNPDSKHHVISNMDSIYQQASLTIIAAAGKDAEHGLPGVSQTYRRLDFNSSYIVRNEPSTETSNSVWSSRGWTYQEALLSRRCLVFTNTQTTLQCYTASYRERDPFLQQKWHNTINRIHTGDSIFRTINEYVMRELTFSSDSLNAFLGILRLYEKLNHRPVVHIWGLPIFGPEVDPGHRLLVHALLWSASGAPTGLKRVEGIPSWSWAGWRGWADAGKMQMFLTSSHQESFQGPYNDKLAPQALEAANSIRVDVQIRWNGNLWTVFDYYKAKRSCSPATASILPEPMLYVTGTTAQVTTQELIDSEFLIDWRQYKRRSDLTTLVQEQESFTALRITLLAYLLLRRNGQGVYYCVGTMQMPSTSPPLRLLNHFPPNHFLPDHSPPDYLLPSTYNRSKEYWHINWGHKWLEDQELKLQ